MLVDCGDLMERLVKQGMIMMFFGGLEIKYRYQINQNVCQRNKYLKSPVKHQKSRIWHGNKYFYPGKDTITVKLISINQPPQVMNLDLKKDNANLCAHAPCPTYINFSQRLF